MARTKVKLAFVTNNSKRKITYNKRKNNLLKVNELSTLCNVLARGVIFGQDYPEPEVWPSTMGVQHVIVEYNKLSEVHQTIKNLNQYTFLRQIVGKFTKQLHEKQIKNREMKITEQLSDTLCSERQKLPASNLQNLNVLDKKIEKKLKEVHKRFKIMENVGPHEIQVHMKPSLS
ncbi:hypothetical protein M9H77_17221 [Catharanthus roseus]|uniref:Uncharacterized protein n=1 Tax=Catharanthus roseus TaxID=4058 RepID=A0ACC0B3Z7_CATRO|nr:hypothetical protein M9H77_17221 [Catharanthus roseus]